MRASERRRAFGKLLKRVYSSDEHLLVERDGTPAAVLMSYREYRELIRQRSVAALEQLGPELGCEIERQGVSEEELLNATEESKRQVYREEYNARPDYVMRHGGCQPSAPKVWSPGRGSKLGG